MQRAPRHICLAYQALEAEADKAQEQGRVQRAVELLTKAHNLALEASREGLWIPGQERSPLLQKGLGSADWSPVGDGTRHVGIFAPLPRVLAATLPDLAPHDMSPSHMTFLYLGQGGRHVAQVCREVLGRGFEGRVRFDRLGEFNTPDGLCVHARLHVPERLRALRMELVTALQARGVQVSDHSLDAWDWAPHVTLGYLRPGERPTGELARWMHNPALLQSLTWTVDRLELWGAPEPCVVQLRSQERIFSLLAQEVFCPPQLPGWEAGLVEAQTAVAPMAAGEGEVEIHPALGRLLYKAQREMLQKSREAPKYIRRVPYTDAKGKRRYRYYYTVGGGKGLGHEDEVKVGAVFVTGDKQQRITVQALDGTDVSIKIEGPGADGAHKRLETKIPRQMLLSLLQDSHAEALEEHKKKTLKTLEDAKKHGSEKQKEKAQKRAQQYGYLTLGEPLTPKPFHWSATEPPNWRFLDHGAIGLRRYKNSRGFQEAAMNMHDPFLKEIGWYKVLEGRKRDHFLLTFLLSNQGSKGLSEKQLDWMRDIQEQLALWWSDLTDEERDTFARKYCDHKNQLFYNAPTPTVGGPAAPALPEDQEASAELKIPEGMEKMTAMGWKPHPYQARAVNFLTQRADGRGIWAMEMGLGKTMSALLAFHKLKEEGKVDRMIVSSPINALGSWRWHLDKLSNARWAIVTGTPKKRQEIYDRFERGELDVIITTTDAVDNDGEQIKKAIGSRAALGRVFRVVDELHKYKNPKAKRTIALREIFGGENPGYVVGMTGTVKPNKGVDFYHAVENVRPGALGRNEWKFAERYCHIISGYKKEIGGFRDDAQVQLRKDTKDFIFARTTTDPDVNLSLPKRHDLVESLDTDKTTATLERHLKEAAVLYQASLGNFKREEDQPPPDPIRAAQMAQNAKLEIEALAAKGDLASICYHPSVIPKNFLGLIGAYRKLAVHPRVLHSGLSKHLPKSYESPKIEHCADSVVDHLQNHPDKGAVVFGFYKEGLSVFQMALADRGIDPSQVGYIDGSMSSKRREELCDALNQGKIKVLVAQRNSMQEGANLQHRANLVVHIDTPYEPASLTQSTARVYRQGQQHVTTVVRPVCGAIESRIESAVAGKIVESGKALGKIMDSEAALYASISREGGKGMSPAELLELLGIEPGIFSRHELEAHTEEDTDAA